MSEATSMSLVNSMSKLRRDPILQRWVIIAPDRAELQVSRLFRQSKGPPPEECPFCPGNEGRLPTEIFAVRELGTSPNAVGWWVRVVPDERPILRIEGSLGRSTEGMYDTMNAIGAHEIVVETPGHEQHRADLDDLQLTRIFSTYRERMRDLKNDERFRHIIMVKYDGVPGSPSQHQHSYLKEELNLGTRTVWHGEGYLAFAPFASRLPYEIWIVPKAHASQFIHVEDEELRGLALSVRGVLSKLRKALQDPPYSLVLHTSPLDAFPREAYHWHLEVVPHLFQAMGFGWGAAISLNPITPEQAAAHLREIGGPGGVQG
ncbi:MAG: galactose-1-phosphate uridylyltransferase [candidate division NC10 bacterium]|nr:galactose-1-phosphate uridylyltransferase [candidate division NC10 bacterium]